MMIRLVSLSLYSRGAKTLLLLLGVVVSALLLLTVDLQGQLYADSLHESRTDLEISQELKIMLVVCSSSSTTLLDSTDRQLQQAKVAIKAAIFLSHRRIRFLIVSDSQAIFAELVASTEAWPKANRERSSFQFVASWYPPEHEDMRGLFRPCASQRLFLLRLLPEESAVLYMDSDVIFLRPPEELWKIFNEFNEEQFAAAAAINGPYNHIPKKVRYSDVGFNAGLMLYNLTRMRQFPAGWEDQVLNITAEYRRIFLYGDQDILNIFFGKFRSHFHALGCEWNLRPAYCQLHFIRICPTLMRAGGKMVHGVSGSFYTPGKFMWISYEATAFMYKDSGLCLKNVRQTLAFFKSWEALNMTQPLAEFQAELRKNLAAATQKDVRKCREREYVDRILSQQLISGNNN